MIFHASLWLGICGEGEGLGDVGVHVCGREEGEDEIKKSCFWEEWRVFRYKNFFKSLIEINLIGFIEPTNKVKKQLYVQ